jgi:hypothetical protein
MPSLTVTIKTAKYGALTATVKVESVRDLPRLFRRAEAAIKQAARVFPDVAESKVESITVRPE